MCLAVAFGYDLTASLKCNSIMLLTSLGLLPHLSKYVLTFSSISNSPKCVVDVVIISQ